MWSYLEGGCGGCLGLGCFGWAGSDSWLVFPEPVVEGGAGALVVGYEGGGHWGDLVSDEVECLACCSDGACLAVAE